MSMGRFLLFGMEKNNRLGGMHSLYASSDTNEALVTYAQKDTYLERWHTFDCELKVIVSRYSKPNIDYMPLDFSTIPHLGV